MKNRQMAYITGVLGFLLFFSRSALYSTQFVITNTDDSGTGSLRQALLDAGNHTGHDTLIFQIPETDAGYNTAQHTWTIQPVSQLPVIIWNSLFMDGLSQAAFIGTDTNPSGPEIVIDGHTWRICSPVQCCRSFLRNLHGPHHDERLHRSAEDGGYRIEIQVKIWDQVLALNHFLKLFGMF